MSSRPYLSPYPVIINGDMTTTLISIVTIASNYAKVSYDISWSGTAPTGVVTVQVSNTYTQDAAGKPANPGNWTTLQLSNPTNISGNTGNGFIDIDATAGHAVRLVYTPTSGSGSLNVTVAGKV